MHAGDTKLSSRITISRYRELEQVRDKAGLGVFIKERFEERYFKPLEDSVSKHGFTILAVACLVIETLESFYQGRADTHGKSAKMFSDFLRRETPLKVFGSSCNWFFKDIRCAILHQGEVRGGWRIWRKGPLLDMNGKTINATQFLRELRKAVAGYVNELQQNDECWRKFRKKMNAVCANCGESLSAAEPIIPPDAAR
ncbi:MAG: hypothetical protein U1A72_08065 [Sulfuritalea sp.]|nr:hypothetical protein [Sulfuritalea sp.]